MEGNEEFKSGANINRMFQGYLLKVCILNTESYGVCWAENQNAIMTLELLSLKIPARYKVKRPPRAHCD